MSRLVVTTTGGRDATTRHIFGQFALSVGKPDVIAPKGWKWVKLTDFARLESGHTPSKRHPEYWGGDVPWIGIRDAKAHHGETIHETIQTTNDLGIQNSSARILPKGTVCLSRTASVGYVVTMARPMATSQDFANWVCSDNLDCRFLVYLLLAEQESLLRFASGAIHQTIYYPELKALHICMPSLPEQQRIVAILDDALAGLETVAANVQKNLKNAGELFDSYLNSAFTQKNESWVVKMLSDVCRKITVGHVGPMAKRYKQSGVPFLRSQNIRPFEIALDDVVFIDEDFHRSLAKSQLLPGDVAIVRTGYPGTAAVIPETLKTSNCADLVIVRTDEQVDPGYIAAFFNSSHGKGLVSGNLVGTAQKHFNIGAAKAVKIRLPPKQEQRRLVEEMRVFRSASRRLELLYQQKLSNLADLKQSILTKAFSGEMTSLPSSAINEAAE